MRILRGTGVEGLTGIPRVREETKFQIARPLLSINKADLIAYCAQRNISPREDSSNQKNDYHRNFLRLSVIPWLEDHVNPALQNALVQLSEIANAENAFIESATEEMSRQVIHSREKNRIIIMSKPFLNNHLALQRRLIKLIFTYLRPNHANIGFTHINQVCAWIKDGRTSSRLELPNGFRVAKQYDRVLFTVNLPIEQQGNNVSPFQYLIEAPGRTYIKEIRTWVVAQIVDRPPSWNTQDEVVAMFDLDQIKGSVIARNRRAGDKMDLFGVNGSKKIKDLFIDEKIPVTEREQIPILADEQGIIWIPKVRRSNRALITKQTRRALIIHVDEDD